MSQILRISEAASIGIHGMILIGESKQSAVSTKQIANEFDISDNHCAKVMQRLTRAGLITAIRGPKGGFILRRPASEITILQIYEAIDGPLDDINCFFQKSGCNPCCGLFGNLMQEANDLVRKHFGPTTLETIIKNRNN